MSKPVRECRNCKSEIIGYMFTRFCGLGMAKDRYGETQKGRVSETIFTDAKKCDKFNPRSYYCGSLL